MKNKKSKQKKIHFSKKRIFIILSILLAFFLLGFGIGKLYNHIQSKKLNVALFNIEQEIALPIQQKIQEKYLEINPKGKINFVVLEENPINTKKISKKYDLFISWDGLVINKLKEYSKDIPITAQNKIIKTINAKKSLPLLINHWELNYHKDTRLSNQLDFPGDFIQYKAYLEQIKDSVFVPFFMAGKDDDTLLAYISVVAEAMYANEGYTELINAINNANSFKELISKEDTASNIIKTILGDSSLDVKNKITPESFIVGGQKDIQAFTEDNQIGVLFTSLLNHRKMDMRLMERYESERMSVLWTGLEHSLIAPCVTIMNFGNKKLGDILEYLVQNDVQSFLSDESKLAPTNIQTMAFDAQADDVRYLAAIAPKGPVPDIANACFQLDSKKKAQFAQDIREYIRKSF